MTPSTAIRPGDPETERHRDAIDWSVLDSMKLLQQPGKPDLLKQLMTIYLTSSPPLMEGIRSAIASRDREALMHAAHSLKSSSLSLGATGLGETCASLEQMGKAGSMGDAPALLNRAETQFAAVTSAFRQALEQDAP
jgi:HPt (histidine-containing phosphotransfer) domain-containing protein